jgi:hypothetical protein
VRADQPTASPPGRSAWSAAVGIDDGREPWADTVAARESPTRVRAKRWVAQPLRAPRALERLRQTQGNHGNRPLLVGSPEQVDDRPVRVADPKGGLVQDTDREAVDDTQAGAFLPADRLTVGCDDEPERGGGGRAR